jgi:hypothetical protein
LISPAVIRANLLPALLTLSAAGISGLRPPHRFAGYLTTRHHVCAGSSRADHFAKRALILQQIVPRLPRPEEVPPDRLDSREWFQTFGLFVLTIAYTALLPWLGFLLVTPLYLTAALVVSGAGWRPRTGVIAVVVTG